MVLATEDWADVAGEANVDDNILGARVVVDRDVAQKGEAVAGVHVLEYAAENVVEGWEGGCCCI